MRIKQCFNPDCAIKYREDMEEYKLDNCCKCGAPIVILPEEVIYSNDENSFGKDSIKCSNDYDNNQRVDVAYVDDKEKEKDVIFKLLPNGEIVISENENINFDVEGARLIIYSGVTPKDVYKIEYDEVTIGRRNVTEIPDIDLSIYDRNKVTSRRHALIYKFKDKFYVRNESSKNSLHVNKKAITRGESIALSNGDLIILSRSYVLEFLE